MSQATVTSFTDVDRHVVDLALAGPLTSAEHCDQLLAAADRAGTGYGLIVDLSSVSLISEIGLEALRSMARTSRAQGNQVVFVCAELMMRSELVLADLDTLAPVVQAHEQAVPLVAFAA
jgi:anti-anti-sigma regulatory factor